MYLLLVFITAGLCFAASSKEEITQIVEEVITKTNATSIKDMGIVMKNCKEKIGASADGKTINEIVKELLS